MNTHKKLTMEAELEILHVRRSPYVVTALDDDDLPVFLWNFEYEPNENDLEDLQKELRETYEYKGSLVFEVLYDGEACQSNEETIRQILMDPSNYE